MCKAHVLRFSCAHGVLMSLEPCNIGPCPVLKTTGARLPQQPRRCYNCQYKLERKSTSTSSISSSSRNHSCRSSRESLTSASSTSSSPPLFNDTFSVPSSKSKSVPTHPLPNVAVQPTNCTGVSAARPSLANSGRSFSFSCNGSGANHFPTPHYALLPDYLPHQDHSCPPCQLEELRAKADADVARLAQAEYPNLRAEMLVRDGRVWEEWQTKPTLEKYTDEKRTEEREMWLHVTRKWTQDLKKARVLVAEEDGLGLFA